jgi:hypothetical protein
MKTLRLLIAALLITGTASAQFFQRVYGSNTNRDYLESGMNYDFNNLPVAQKGQVMCGFTDFGGGTISPMVTRTLLNGNPVFNNKYQFNVPNGQQVQAMGRRVYAFPGGRIGVIGDFTFTPGQQHTTIFYMLLNPNGAPAFVRTYQFPNVMSVEATSLTPSVFNPANAYACGNITDAAGGRHPFILSIQAFNNGNLNWGHEYLDINFNAFEWTVEDCIESPYANQCSGLRSLALVGRHVLTPGAPGQGCLFTVDITNGMPDCYVHLYGNAGDDDGFNAIIVARNPFGGSPGYAIAGSTFNSGASFTYDMWGLKVDIAGQVIWSSAIDYSQGGRNDFGYDILERFNPNLLPPFQYEYYLGGYTDNGIFGQEDEVVNKLDFGGNAFPAPGGLNEFTYGGPGWERILQMDYYEFTNPAIPFNNIGLSMFNWTVNSFPVLGSVDFYHVKSYFNGVTACNYVRQPQTWNPGPPLIDSTKGDTFSIVGLRNLVWQTIAMQNAIICTANAVAGGSNARIANSGEFAVSSLFPNPVSADNAIINLTFDLPGVNDAVDIELYNSLGQLVKHTQETLGDGQTLLRVDLGSGLSAGIYTMTVRRNGEMISHKISVQ